MKFIIQAAQRLRAAGHPAQDPDAVKKYGFDPADPDTKAMANAFEYITFDSGMPYKEKPASANWLKHKRTFEREAKRLGLNPTDPKFLKKIMLYVNAVSRHKDLAKRAKQR